MTIAHVAKDATAQGTGVGPFFAVTLSAYTHGEVVQIWIRHRSTVSSCYLTNVTDTVSNRVQVTIDTSLSNTDGTNILQWAIVTVPNNGVTYDRVAMVLSSGSTGNWIKTAAFTTTAGLQTRNAAADRKFNPSGTTGQPSNIVFIDEDVTTTVTGSSEIVFAGSATSAATNTGTASNGFTLNAVEPGSVRGITAWKIVSPPVGSTSSAATRLAWANGTSAVGMVVTVQEQANISTINAAGLRFKGNAYLTLNPTVQSTTTFVPAAFQMVGLEVLKLNPHLVRLITITPAIDGEIAPPLVVTQAPNQNIVITPAVDAEFGPIISTVKDMTLFAAPDAELGGAFTVAKDLVLVPGIDAEFGPPLQVVAPQPPDAHNWEWEAGRVEVPWEAEEVGTWQSE